MYDREPCSSCQQKMAEGTAIFFVEALGYGQFTGRSIGLTPQGFEHLGIQPPELAAKIKAKGIAMMQPDAFQKAFGHLPELKEKKHEHHPA
jgi:hypothetical protein